jgi:hypothetical protein
MKQLVLAILLTLPLFSAPVVQSIEPDHGPASGGTDVAIVGKGLAVTVACLLPCPPRVGFGDVVVDATEESDSRLTVKTPAHPPGTVDVTLYIPGEGAVVVPQGFTFDSGPDSAYERILLPVYFEDEIPGAFGSRWRTDFRIRNNGGTTVTLAPWQCPDGQFCPPVFPLTYALQPNQALHNPENLDTSGRTNPSQLLYVLRSEEPEISMTLRVADVSRSTLNAGTDVPVVRESELLDGTAQLFDIPMDGQHFRVLLRVYDLTYTNAEYSVRLYGEDGLSEPVHGATLTATSAMAGDFRNEAAYAQLDLTALLQLRQVWPPSVRVEIVPLTPGSRYWAFASITNNETQLVTLVTPQ